VSWKSLWSTHRKGRSLRSHDDPASSQPGVVQLMENPGPTNALGSGVQFNFNGPITPEDLSAVLSRSPDAMLTLFKAAGDYLQLPPDLDLKALIYQLAEFVTPADGIPWMVRAAEIASQHVSDPSVRIALSASVNQWAAGTPEGNKLLSDFRTTLRPGESAGEPCLLIMLDQDHNGADEYQLSIIVFRNGRDADPQPSDDSLMSLAEVRRRLRESLPPLIRTLDASSLIVEFVVPIELINTDFDLWHIPERSARAHNRSYAIGVRYAVVVRDIERMSPLDDHSAWRARWRRLCVCSTPVEGAVRWVGPEDGHDYNSRGRFAWRYPQRYRLAHCLIFLTQAFVRACPRRSGCDREYPPIMRKMSVISLARLIRSVCKSCRIRFSTFDRRLRSTSVAVNIKEGAWAFSGMTRTGRGHRCPSASQALL
jgi:hypothetical protein